MGATNFSSGSTASLARRFYSLRLVARLLGGQVSNSELMPIDACLGGYEGYGDLFLHVCCRYGSARLPVLQARSAHALQDPTH